MEMKLFDSELKVMEVLWKEGDLTAGKTFERTDWLEPQYHIHRHQEAD